MATTYRVGFCPPNPGWKSKQLKQIRWFSNLYDLKAHLAEHPSDSNNIWVSYNRKRFVKFNINETNGNSI